MKNQGSRRESLTNNQRFGTQICANADIRGDFSLKEQAVKAQDLSAEPDDDDVCNAERAGTWAFRGIVGMRAEEFIVIQDELDADPCPDDEGNEGDDFHCYLGEKGLMAVSINLK